MTFLPTAGDMQNRFDPVPGPKPQNPGPIAIWALIYTIAAANAFGNA